MSELIALLEGREVGTVRQERGRLNFVYAQDWRASPNAYPLSLSMPLAAAEHSRATIEPFLWGLLPDNDHVLDAWARRFQVSARNPLALLSHVGEDCPGAVQFVRPERRDALLSARRPEIEWLTEADVAARLRDLRADPSAWRRQSDAGQFSLAGAQPKTALLFDGQRWGVPSGRTPTTHILKPPSSSLDGHVENEHFCLALAAALGLPTASAQVGRFEDQIAIVVERYDRFRDGAAVGRTHQEDLCQALGVHPAKKYQSDGGPGAKHVVELLRASIVGGYPQTWAGDGFIGDGFLPEQEAYADTDVDTFLGALIFNWLIGGTDAHAKNYSLLIGAGGQVRLAPLYDLASILVYPQFDPRKAKLAMKIGDEYLLSKIDFDEWRKLAAQIRIDPEAVIGRVRAMAGELPDLASAEAVKVRAAGIDHPIVGKLVDVFSDRARRLAG